LVQQLHQEGAQLVLALLAAGSLGGLLQAFRVKAQLLRQRLQVGLRLPHIGGGLLALLRAVGLALLIERVPQLADRGSQVGKLLAGRMVRLLLALLLVRHAVSRCRRSRTCAWARRFVVPLAYTRPVSEFTTR